MKRVTRILAALLLCSVAIVRADEVIVLENAARDFDTWGTRTNGREQVLEAISRDTGVPITTLEEQRQRTRLGYGGLFIANSLASSTGRTFDEIAALKASGHGWGWIAKQNNVKLGPIISRARNANKPFKDEKIKVKKPKKNSDDSFVDGETDRGHGNGKGHGHDKGPKSNASFHSKGKGKGH